MRLEPTTTVPASPEVVFDKLTDLAWIEGILGARGVVLSQTAGTGVAAGSAWQADFTARGAQRSIRVSLSRCDAPTDIVAVGEGKLIKATVDITLSASGTGTSAQFAVEAEGLSLQGRLLVQSAKLARGRIEKRFAKGVEKLGAQIA